MPGWCELQTPEGQPYYYHSESGQVQWDQPAELQDKEEEKAGEWYWVPEEHDAFRPGKISFEYPSGERVCELDDCREVTVKANVVLEKLSWAALKRDTEDLVMLEYMNEPLILHTLAGRFDKQNIYTDIGTILVSINPYQMFPIYTKEMIHKYASGATKKLPPHVYNIAVTAYTYLRERNKNQSIVISGESGAGKTEATKQCLKFLADVAGSTTNIHEKIVQTSAIFEAFGNAKTVRNDNSSRFGKYSEIYFDSQDRICGATNTSYLLEKVRVVNVASGERNYHIFYQLLSGGTPEQLEKYHISKDEQYRYLGDMNESKDINDVADFKEVQDAMTTLEFKEEEKSDMFQSVAFVLHLGNIQFHQNEYEQAEFDDKNVLRKVASLLEVDEGILQENLTSRLLKIRGQKPTKIEFDKIQANNNRDALAKFYYGRLFDWLVRRLNSAIRVERQELARKTIGILDIFGFEIFGCNSFEQLCINFTNEKLQLFFNEHTFNLEERIYQREKIDFDHVKYKDNQPVLDLIEQKPEGVLLLVDEEIRMPQGSDLKFVQKMHDKHRLNNFYEIVIKNPDNFIIHHYAGRVVYTSTGFLEKNRDTMSEDLYLLLRSSRFGFVRTLFPDAESFSSDSKKRKATLGNQFTVQLNQLMSTLHTTFPHYIRCIKPNHVKAPNKFNRSLVLEQLRYSGVFEAVEIRKKGFPFKLTHKEFFHRYRCVTPGVDAAKDHKKASEDLFHAMKQAMDQIKIGETLCLYKGPEYQSMELHRYLAMDRDVRFLQSRFRSCAGRRRAYAMYVSREHLKHASKVRSVEAMKEALAFTAKTTDFPMYCAKEAVQLHNLIQKEDDINEELEKQIDSGQPKYDRLKVLLKEVDELKETDWVTLHCTRKDIKMSSEWITKGTCVVKMKRSLEEYDQTELKEAMSEADKLGLSTHTDMQKDLVKAQEVLERIKQEETFTEKLREELKADGRLRNGDKSTLSFIIEEQLQQCEHFGMKTPLGRDLLAIGIKLVSLRKTLHSAVETVQRTLWDVVQSALTQFTEAFPNISYLELGLEQELEECGNYLQVIDALDRAVSDVDQESLENWLQKGIECTMVPQGFPIIAQAQQCLNTIITIRNDLQEATEKVVQEFLEISVARADEFRLKIEQVEQTRELRDKVISVNSRCVEALSAELLNIPEHNLSILEDARDLNLSTADLIDLKNLHDDAVQTMSDIQSNIDVREQVKLEELLAHAQELKMDDPAYHVVPEGYQCVLRMVELQGVCSRAMEEVVEDLLVNAVRECDEYNYVHTDQVKQCRELTENVIRQNKLCREALDAESTAPPDDLNDILNVAEELHLVTEDLKTLQQLLDDCIQCTDELWKAVETRDQAYLEEQLDQATYLKMRAQNYDVVPNAEECLNRILELRKLLDDAMQVVVEVDLIHAVQECKNYGYQSPQVGDCTELRDLVIELNIQAQDAAHVTLLPEILSDVLFRADSIRLVTEDTKKIRELLFDIDEETFCQKQLRAAVALKDEPRKRALTIILKDLLFLRRGKEFEFRNYDKFITPDEFVEAKLIPLKKEELRSGFYHHTTTPIHCPLTNLPPRASKEAPNLKKEATKLFKNIMYFMKDRKWKKDPFVPVLEILQKALELPALRDEIFTQIIKQLTKNPTPESEVEGWRLLLICLEQFVCNPSLENFFEYWLRTHADLEIVNRFHEYLYDREPPTRTLPVATLQEMCHQLNRVPTPVPIPHPNTGSKPEKNIPREPPPIPVYETPQKGYHLDGYVPVERPERKHVERDQSTHVSFSHPTAIPIPDNTEPGYYDSAEPGQEQKGLSHDDHYQHEPGEYQEEGSTQHQEYQEGHDSQPGSTQQQPGAPVLANNSPDLPGSTPPPRNRDATHTSATSAASRVSALSAPEYASYASDEELADDESLYWEAILDEESQDVYYYNNKTGETTWDKPACFEDAS